jgi:hypothetical protein
MTFGVRGAFLERRRSQRPFRAVGALFGRRRQGTGSASPAERHETSLPIAFLTASGVAITATTVDLSLTGLRAAVAVPLPAGTLLRVKMPGRRAKHVRVVWQIGGHVGCEFLAPLSPEVFEEMLGPDAEPAGYSPEG